MNSYELVGYKNETTLSISVLTVRLILYTYGLDESLTIEHWKRILHEC